MERITKPVMKIFKDVGFKIEVKSNFKIVHFLDVTLNLWNECYSPYKKLNDNLLYVNISSNHPPQIIKMLPSSINEKLSKNSSNETFNISQVDYETALKEIGYKSVDLKYAKTIEKRYHNRNRNIIWFNPPFNEDVCTNVAKKFLDLLDKHFPKLAKLHKIFKSNNVKVSYSWTENMKSIINSHNKKVTTQNTVITLPCNCRSKEGMPLRRSVQSREHNLQMCRINIDQRR